MKSRSDHLATFKSHLDKMVASGRATAGGNAARIAASPPASGTPATGNIKTVRLYSGRVIQYDASRAAAEAPHDRVRME